MKLRQVRLGGASLPVGRQVGIANKKARKASANTKCVVIYAIALIEYFFVRYQNDFNLHYLQK